MKKSSWILLMFVLLKFYLQYIAINPVYELHRDEYLHIDLGNHLAWGYTTVPPLTGWISFLIITLGKSVFWVKFFPALFGALTIVVVWKMIEELEGNQFALILGATGVLCSALLRINTLYQPNSLEYLIWTMMFYSIIRYIKSEESKWLWMTALSFAFGFLNKYNIGFLLLGLIPAVLLSRHRAVLRHKQLYYAFGVAFIIVLPNLIWQFENDLPVVRHMRTLAESQLVNVDRFGFLRDQLLFFTGSLLTLLAAFFSFFLFPSFRKYQIVLWTYLFVILIYFYLRAKSYYSIGLYPVLLAFGSVYLENLLRGGWKYYLRPVFILIPVGITLALFKVIVPVMTPEEIIDEPDLFKTLGLLRWEDGRDHEIPQDFADMLGWSELGELVDEASDRIENKDQTLIHCDNYGEAGAINFYSSNKHGEALTLDADYLYWYPLKTMEIRNVILVQGPWDDDPDRKRERELFETVELIGQIENPYAREKGTKVYLLKGAKRSIAKILADEIEKRKKGRDR
jgi:hypothetical protein